VRDGNRVGDLVDDLVGGLVLSVLNNFVGWTDGDFEGRVVGVPEVGL